MRLPLLLALATVPGIAWAQPAGAPPGATPAIDPADPVTKPKDIVVVTQPDRPAKNKAILGAIAGGAVLFGGIGLYFHLDSRSASDQVGAKNPTHTVWSTADQAAYDQAHSSATKAEVFYGIGGALLVAAVVTWVLTEPADETTVIHTGAGTPTVTPTPGGAMLGGTWSF